jgi:Rrf2 family transcriptional regulator, iron-sulfur cluster assembly transcription factor
MMLTTKGRYAVTAILELASLPPGNPVRLSELAHMQNIPVNYLEQIFAKLKKASLVRAVKGPGGGYLLNTDPKEMRIADIIDAVEENIEMSACALKKQNNCTKTMGAKCKTHNLWHGLTRHIRGYFEGITLQDIISAK